MRSLLQLPSGSVRELLCLVAVAAQRGIGRHERKSRVPMMTVPIDNNLVLVAVLMLRPYFAYRCSRAPSGVFFRLSSVIL
jgi:hypothetical protein